MTYDQTDVDDLLKKDFEEMSDDELGLILMHVVQSCMRAHSRRMRFAELREQRRLKRPLTDPERRRVWQEELAQDRARLKQHYEENIRDREKEKA
ncbi:MAG: hypothetical protein OYK82_09160 [Gammaproteobacteria bacterium]|nr:hypothetical protein [Gammaproteobacteria bacterium]